MTNPPDLVFIGFDGYFILIFLQKSGYIIIRNRLQYFMLSNALESLQKKMKKI